MAYRIWFGQEGIKHLKEKVMKENEDVAIMIAVGGAIGLITLLQVLLRV
jgi:hypothetical protein